MNKTKYKKCPKEIIFLSAKSGKLLPINAEMVEEGDVQYIHGKHISHFSDCPAAIQFRKSKS